MNARKKSGIFQNLLFKSFHPEIVINYVFNNHDFIFLLSPQIKVNEQKKIEKLYQWWWRKQSRYAYFSASVGYLWWMRPGIRFPPQPQLQVWPRRWNPNTPWNCVERISSKRGRKFASWNNWRVVLKMRKAEQREAH